MAEEVKVPTTTNKKSVSLTSEPSVHDALQDEDGDDGEDCILTGPKLYTILFSLSSANFLMALDMSILTTAILLITEKFQSTTDIGWHISAYTLSMSAVQPLSGNLYANFLYEMGVSLPLLHLRNRFRYLRCSNIVRDVFNKQFVKALMEYVPDVDLQALLAAGTVGFHKVIKPEQTAGVVLAYIDAILDTFYLGVAITAIAFLFALGLPWIKVKGKKPGIGAA